MKISLLLSGIYLLIGSYAPSSQEGIHVYDFNETTGQVTRVGGASGVSGPSFLCMTKDGTRVYAVGEDGRTSTANVFSFDKETGRMELLGTQSTHGSAPCNITLSPREDFVFTANYNGGSITQFPVDKDGLLQPGHEIRFSGSSVHPDRQTKAYLHAVNFSPDGRFLMGTDLGTDRVHLFPWKKGKKNTILGVQDGMDLKVDAGAGPRHLAWAPDGEHVYLLGELSGQLFSIRYHRGEFSIIQTLQADSLNAGGSADIHVSLDGKHVYASHRLRGDGVSIFQVQKDGTLKRVGYQSTGGHPRNFLIMPDGRFVLVACRDTNQVEIYRRDASTGLLTDTGERINVRQPVCLKLIRR